MYCLVCGIVVWGTASGLCGRIWGAVVEMFLRGVMEPLTVLIVIAWTFVVVAILASVWPS